MFGPKRIPLKDIEKLEILRLISNNKCFKSKFSVIPLRGNNYRIVVWI